ncbi:MAG: 50S ribosomal protein L22 [Bdellovibrionales bacterium]|nr:50S ribosomal protein L22 [Bdellovibrionales bacterium]
MDGYISKATLRNIRVSPRRARLVVDMVRGKKVEEAINILEFANKKTAPLLKKLLMSAVANAREQSSVDIDELMVKLAWVDEGRTLKRFTPRAHGRATPVLKRHSHITVVLDELGTA